MEYRTEHDSMGEIQVPAERLWGAQTERSRLNFAIGRERMPQEIIRALIMVKQAAARVNHTKGRLDEARAKAIGFACTELLEHDHAEEFPLKVWQTGSGTQTNMNVNEVIAHLAMKRQPDLQIHPNDHVNCSQSSNDVFPTAMHMAAVLSFYERLEPAIGDLVMAFEDLRLQNKDIIKVGRTHLQDAVPVRFSQEISGWGTMLTENLSMLNEAFDRLRALAIGGTATGTGLNAPKGFDGDMATELSAMTGEHFRAAANKFHALSSKDAYVYAHGALKALAANLMKIANDIRWLSSGPRAGLAEIRIPANEPGSSIMPGKVNPTQCEMITMIAVQVMGNDTTVGMAASQGNFELNVYMPVLAYNMMQSITLLADGIRSFEANCVRGIQADRARMEELMSRSLMMVTALTPKTGYEQAAKAAHKAYEENLSLKEAVLSLGLMSEEEFDDSIRPEKMV